VPNDNRHEHGGDADHNTSISRYAFMGFTAIALYFLITQHWIHITEHWGHIAGFLPFLLLAACPLIHLFMHHGHGGNDSQNTQPPSGPGHGTHQP
jgi:hypothetical protein